MAETRNDRGLAVEADAKQSAIAGALQPLTKEQLNLFLSENLGLAVAIYLHPKAFERRFSDYPERGKLTRQVTRYANVIANFN